MKTPIPQLPDFPDETEMMKDPICRMGMRLPFSLDWVEYDGETVVAQFNYEASKQARRAMIDLSDCMTKALCQSVFQTVPYEAERFAPSALGHTYWEPKTPKPNK